MIANEMGIAAESSVERFLLLWRFFAYISVAVKSALIHTNRSVFGVICLPYSVLTCPIDIYLSLLVKIV